MSKKGGKKAPLTEEEKLALMQQKAQAEAEKARQRQAARSKMLVEKLRNEERNCEANLRRVRQKWREIQGQTRVEELHKDIDITYQNTRRILAQKDNYIKTLISVLNKAEQQTEMALNTHLEKLNCLSELHKGLHSALEIQWKCINDKLIAEYITDKEEIKQQHQQQIARLEDITLAMAHKSAEIENEAQKNYQNACEKIKTQTNEAIQMLPKRKKDIKDKYQQQHVIPLEDDKDKSVVFQEKQNVCEQLRTRDLHDAQKIELQKNQLQKMQDTIDTLRLQLSSIQRDNETCAHGLRAARDDVTNKTGELKDKLSLIQADNKRHLTDLTVDSNSTTKKLENFFKKGKKILRKAQIYGKLETVQERVRPFYASSLGSEELSQEEALTLEPQFEELAQVVQDHAILETFWQRYNKVKLDCECQLRENALLEQENEQLLVLLSRYTNERPLPN